MNTNQIRTIITEEINEVLDKKFGNALKQRLLNKPQIDDKDDDFDSDAYEESLDGAFEYIRDVKNEWCVHISNHADKIWKDGFTVSNPNLGDSLVLSHLYMFKESNEGYNFAYLAEQMPGYDCNLEDYGQNAVMFIASGVLIHHNLDQDNQVVFYNNDARNFVLIKGLEGENFWNIEWCVMGNVNGNEKIIYKGEDLNDCVEWVMQNYNPYRKVLSNRTESKARQNNMKNSVYNKW